MKTPSQLTNRQLFAYALKHGIERDEVYEPGAPAHWPKDRCYRPETNDEFAERIRELVRKS